MVGIDISKETLDAALWSHDGSGGVLGTFANTPDGWQALGAALRTRVGASAFPTLAVTMEPTGGYELAFALWAQTQGWAVSMPNPRLVRAWLTSRGRRAKTDRLDSLGLAQYGAQVQPPLWQPLPSAVAELDSLLRRKEELETLLRQERNRLAQYQTRPGMAPAVPQSVERLLRAVEEELRQIEEAITQHVQTHDQLRQTRARLRTVPGIGAKNSLVLLVLLTRWHVLTQGQGTTKGVVAYVGLDPVTYESGTSVHRPAGISRMGRRRERRSLYLGALGTLRGTNPAHTLYARLVARGKPKKVALIAAARKILTWAWAVFRTEQPFNAANITA